VGFTNAGMSSQFCLVCRQPFPYRIMEGLPVILEELQKSLLNSSFSWRSERCNFFIPMM
jgi:hypothetical protein